MLDTLPDEVLLRIVAFSSRLNGCVGKLTCFNQLRFVFALAQVNRRLRALAYHTYLLSIRSVDFSNENSTRFLSAETFRIVSRCRNVNSFALVYGRVEDNSAEWIGRLLQSTVSKLVLTGTCGIGPRTFCCFRTTPMLCAPLQYLDLSYASQVDAEVLRLVAYIRTLRTLKLVGCTRVEDDSIACLVTGPTAQTLCSVNLSYCMVSDAGLAVLLGKLPSLSLLELAELSGNLWATGAYTKNGISQLIQCFPQVHFNFVV
jgi:hypothetical protein